MGLDEAIQTIPLGTQARIPSFGCEGSPQEACYALETRKMTHHSQTWTDRQHRKVSSPADELENRRKSARPIFRVAMAQASGEQQSGHSITQRAARGSITLENPSIRLIVMRSAFPMVPTTESEYSR